MNSLKIRVRTIICILLIEIPLHLFSQGIKVKEMKQIMSDLSASTHQRCDSSGVPCGLVKVQINNPSLKFGHQAVGTVDNKVNEYWVYLPKGAKELTIKRHNYLPMLVRFTDYGIEEIESKICYQLLLKESSFNHEKNTIVINVKPNSAKVIIDNNVIDADKNGSYKLFLEKGEHVFKVFADGYRPAIEIAKTGKGLQYFDIELESIMADVNLSCQTSDAEIYVNNNKIGTGSWQGNLPAGNYVVEARKNGYLTSSMSVLLTEKEYKSLVLPALKKAIIPIIVKSTPSDCFSRKISIDGNVVGSDSICKISIPAGKHNLEIKISGCIAISKSINIEKADTLIFQLEPENTLFASAYNGDYLSCYKLGRSYASSNKNDISQSKYWFDKVINSIGSIDSEWLIKCYEEIISFYIEKVNDTEAIKKVMSQMELILNNQHPDWSRLCEKDIARAYQKNKNYDLAILWFKKWIPKAKEIDSYNFSYAYEDLANCYKEIGDTDQALNYMLKAHAIYANYHYDIASLYYEKGDIPNAIIWYKKFYKVAKYDKKEVDYVTLNQVEFIKEMKKKGIYEKVVK